MNYYTDFISQLVWHFPETWTVVAQNITDPNIVGQMQQAFNHFVQTGQVWAMLIGLIIGYVFRNLTTYG